MNLCIPRDRIHASQLNYFKEILGYEKPFIPRNESDLSQISDFEKTLLHEYPCDLVEPGEKCGIIVELNDQSISIDIKKLLDEKDLPYGIYYLNLVPCTCSCFLRISRKVQALFNKEVSKTNCRVHNKEFDVYLRSDQSLSFMKRQLELGLNHYC